MFRYNKFQLKCLLSSTPPHPQDICVLPRIIFNETAEEYINNKAIAKILETIKLDIVKNEIVMKVSTTVVTTQIFLLCFFH